MNDLSTSVLTNDLAANPLLADRDGPFGLPPFARIRPGHFLPAFTEAMDRSRREIEAIAENAAAPDFDNTVAALDRSGRLLTSLGMLFFNLAASETSPALQAVEREVVPRLAAHRAAIWLHEGLFARFDALHRRRGELGLDPEALRLLERFHLDFTLAGARLSAAARARVAEIDERLAGLYARFRQNLLADEAAWQLELGPGDDLAGLPAELRDAAQSAAQQRGMPDTRVITLSRSLVVPFLTCSDRRDLRRRVFEAWASRGEHAGEHDNRPVLREILALRAELARLHGHASFADYALVDRMAGTPAAVTALLARVWEPAKAKAAAELADIREMARTRGESPDIEPWDWRYYADKVRAARFDFDDAAIKPYFSLDRMLEAAFDCAQRLFGIRFVHRPDVAAYHPDVRVYEVHGPDGGLVGVFLSDNFARPTKRGGAWMSAYRAQSRIDGDAVLPIIVNNNNFSRAPEGEPTLLSADDLRTLFHEFGHGLHGLLSDVTYERLSGTNVLRDFVELPSQIFEHWAFEPEVLRRHARHWQTGEPIPDPLLERFRASLQFNQGFETVEYTACALVDMALHALPDPASVDIAEFEQAELARIGMPREMVMRHRLPHFGHLFGGNGYSAGYYVYMWAEVLDADGYAAFTEAGDPFDPAVAARLRRFIYSSGGSLDPAAAYRAFRGRDARVEPMLAERGLPA